jgi:hypothetical protein
MEWVALEFPWTRILKQLFFNIIHSSLLTTFAIEINSLDKLLLSLVLADRLYYRIDPDNNSARIIIDRRKNTHRIPSHTLLRHRDTVSRINSCEPHNSEMLPPELTRAASLTTSHIGARTRREPGGTIPSIREMEHNLILQALDLTSGSVREAAKHLGLSEATLYRKIKKFGISRTFTEQQ